MTDDPEPKRYWEWIGWKLRLEEKMYKEEDDQLEMYLPRKKISERQGSDKLMVDANGVPIQQHQLQMTGLMKRQISDMQEQIHYLQIRVKELVEENYRLRKENANI